MSKKTTALVIVDVQPVYVPCDSTMRVIKVGPSWVRTNPVQQSYVNILTLFRQALKDKLPVVVLEIIGVNSKTCEDITTKMNSRCVLKGKTGSDGSAEVMQGLSELKVEPDRLVFCGYNYNACVHATIRSIRPMFKGEIVVVQDATNYYEYSRNMYSELNVKHHQMYPEKI